MGVAAEGEVKTALIKNTDGSRHFMHSWTHLRGFFTLKGQCIVVCYDTVSLTLVQSIFLSYNKFFSIHSKVCLF